MKLLVTGGAGYIGSHFAKAATRQGHDAVVWDNLSTGHKEFALKADLVVGDLLETDRLARVLEQHRVDAVVHFAAKALVEESVRRPDLYASNNVEGTSSLLLAMKRVGVRKLIFSSSCAVYGIPKKVPIQEDDPKLPVHPYGQSKWDCERMIHAAAEAGQIQAACLRYFNVIGCDPEGELFEKHDPETHIVPNIFRAILRGEAFRLYGDDYPTPDGTCVRDYVDVNDLADVHLQALAELAQAERKLLISNIGRGAGLTNRQVIEAVAQVLGRHPRIEVHPRRAGDPPVLFADASFFRSWYSKGLRELSESLGHVARHLKGFE